MPLTDVTFGAGPVFPSVSFPFNVNDDIALEDPEVFFLEITDPSNNPQIQIGGSMLAFDFIVFNQTEVTVLDDDGTCVISVVTCIAEVYTVYHFFITSVPLVHYQYIPVHYQYTTCSLPVYHLLLSPAVVIVGFSGQANTVNEGSSAVTLSRSTVVARAFTIQVQGGEDWGGRKHYVRFRNKLVAIAA